MKKLLLIISLALSISMVASDVRVLPGSNVRIMRQDLHISEPKAVLDMDLCFDSTALRHTTYLALTPIICTSEDSLRLHTLLLVDRRSDIVIMREGVDPRWGDDCQVVKWLGKTHGAKRNRMAEQSETYTDSFEWASWMDTAVVYLEQLGCGCGDTLPEGIALGPTTMPDLCPLAQLIEAQHMVEQADSIKIYELHGTAYVNFVVDRWEVKPDYMDNKRELAKITDTLDIMVADRNITVRSIQIHGWASPESPYSHNEFLATNRAKALTNYVRGLYYLPDSVFLPAEATPENWIGLIKHIDENGSKLANSRSIRKMIGDPEKLKGVEADRLEWKIKQQYPADYQYMLEQWYPHLRRSDYEVYFTVRSFTPEEAKRIIVEHPYQLSLKEMMDMAHTYELYSEDYNAVILVAYNIYGRTHEEAAINMANVLIRQGQLKRAADILEQLSDSPAACNALGVLRFCEGNYDGARIAFEHALSIGATAEVIEHNMKLIERMEKYMLK